MTVVLLVAGAAAVLPAAAADDAAVKAATARVTTGAKKVGAGKIVEGVGETAKGVGETVVEGAKFTGAKLKDAGGAAEPKAKSAWEKARAGAVDFGQGVARFFSSLFGG